jgi:hypothetical protein
MQLLAGEGGLSQRTSLEMIALLSRRSFHWAKKWGRGGAPTSHCAPRAMARRLWQPPPAGFLDRLWGTRLNVRLKSVGTWGVAGRGAGWCQAWQHATPPCRNTPFRVMVCRVGAARATYRGRTDRGSSSQTAKPGLHSACPPKHERLQLR